MKFSIFTVIATVAMFVQASSAQVAEEKINVVTAAQVESAKANFNASLAAFEKAKEGAKLSIAASEREAAFQGLATVLEKQYMGLVSVELLDISLVETHRMVALLELKIAIRSLMSSMVDGLKMKAISAKEFDDAMVSAKKATAMLDEVLPPITKTQEELLAKATGLKEK